MSTFGARHGTQTNGHLAAIPHGGLMGGIVNPTGGPSAAQPFTGHPDVGQSAQAFVGARDNTIQYADPNAGQGHAVRHFGLDPNVLSQLSNLMVVAVGQNVNVISARFLPYVRKTDNTIIQWDEAVYPSAVMQDLPDRGVPQVNVNTSERKIASMTRIGCAIQMELSQHIRTPGGQQVLLNSIIQARNSGTTRLLIEMMNKILSVGQHAHYWANRFNNDASETAARTAKQRAYKNFMAVNKDVNGLNHLETEATTLMAQWNEKPQAVLLPHLAMTFLDSAPSRMDYSCVGPDGAKFVGSLDTRVTPKGRCTIIESVPISMGGTSSAVDLTSRTVAVYTAALMRPDLGSKETVIFDQDGVDGAKATKTVSEALDYTVVFSPDTGAPRPDVISSFISKSGGAAGRNVGPLSPFITRTIHGSGAGNTRYATLNHLGEMDPAYLDDETVRRLAAHNVAAIKTKVGASVFAQAIASITSYISMFRSARMSADVFIASVQYAAGLRADAAGWTSFIRGSSHGVPRLEDGLLASYFFIGYLNVGPTKVLGVDFLSEIGDQDYESTGGETPADRQAALAAWQTSGTDATVEPAPNQANKAFYDQGELNLWAALYCDKAAPIRAAIGNQLDPISFTLSSNVPSSDASMAALSVEARTEITNAIGSGLVQASNMPSFSASGYPLGYSTWAGTQYLADNAGRKTAVGIIYAQACDAAAAAVKAWNLLHSCFEPAVPDSSLIRAGDLSVFTQTSSDGTAKAATAWDSLVAGDGSNIFVPVLASGPKDPIAPSGAENLGNIDILSSISDVATVLASTQEMDRINQSFEKTLDTLMAPDTAESVKACLDALHAPEHKVSIKILFVKALQTAEQLYKASGSTQTRDLDVLRLGVTRTLDQWQAAFISRANKIGAADFFTRAKQLTQLAGAVLKRFMDCANAAIDQTPDAHTKVQVPKTEGKFLTSLLVCGNLFRDPTSVFELFNMASVTAVAASDSSAAIQFSYAKAVAGGSISSAIPSDAVKHLSQTFRDFLASKVGAVNNYAGAKVGDIVQALRYGGGSGATGSSLWESIAFGTHNTLSCHSYDYIAIPLMISQAEAEVASQNMIDIIEAAARDNQQPSLLDFAVYKDNVARSVFCCGAAPSLFPVRFPVVRLFDASNTADPTAALRNAQTQKAALSMGHVAGGMTKMKNVGTHGRGHLFDVANQRGLISSPLGASFVTQPVDVKAASEGRTRFGCGLLALMPKERVATIHNMSLADRIGSVWIFAKFNKNCLKSMSRHGLAIPFTIALIRRQMYVTGTIAFLSSQLGNTYYGFPNLMSGADVVQKMGTWVFSMYAGVVITRPRGVALYQDAIGMKNLRGAGREFVRPPATAYPSIGQARKDLIRKANTGQSIMACLAPAGIELSESFDIYDPTNKMGLKFYNHYFKWSAAPNSGSSVPVNDILSWNKQHQNGTECFIAYHQIKHADGSIEQIDEQSPMGPVNDIARTPGIREGRLGFGMPLAAGRETYIRRADA